MLRCTTKAAAVAGLIFRAPVLMHSWDSRRQSNSAASKPAALHLHLPCTHSLAAIRAAMPPQVACHALTMQLPSQQRSRPTDLAALTCVRANMHLHPSCVCKPGLQVTLRSTSMCDTRAAMRATLHLRPRCFRRPGPEGHRLGHLGLTPDSAGQAGVSLCALCPNGGL